MSLEIPAYYLAVPRYRLEFITKEKLVYTYMILLQCYISS
jgi:hypothetical protein